MFSSGLTATEYAPSSAWPSAHGPAPVSLTQPAVPAGWVIAPVGVSRFRRATASLKLDPPSPHSPLALTATDCAPLSAWPSAHGPAPVWLTQPAVPAG